ncbi:hypothetical protein HanXRQr2_Chr06g0239351 [Helianthus annuus]|uniref:Uncharacterized protein n=1 Tax=Helianthus annuus TaxID=4232 RepID=A0A9K3IPE0_HELAN|nr:hypothetical protein HanXRQr2_Chr06g0239351 [Helianthus annuus]
MSFHHGKTAFTRMSKGKAPICGRVSSMRSMKIWRLLHPLLRDMPICLKKTRRLMNWRKRPLPHLLKHSTKTSTINSHTARLRKRCGIV